MSDLSGFPFVEVEFGRDGAPLDAEQGRAAVRLASDGGITDLVVFSHGWNNNEAEAGELYATFFKHFALVRQIQAGLLAGRRIGVVGVFWPSKKFDDRDLIPGGAASLEALSESERLREFLQSLKGERGFDAPDADARLDRAAELVDALETDPDARAEFAQLLRSLNSDLGEDEKRDGTAAAHYRKADGDALGALAPGGELVADDDAGGADSGGAAGGVGGLDGGDEGAAAGGLGSIFGGVVAGARMLANLTTYYQMKARAGTVGTRGLAPLLREIRAAAPELRIHLVGHSFGARLVTAAAASAPAELRVATLTLLQAAFSHDAFAAPHDGREAGFFRAVATGRVTGPALVTHTRNDKAVGLAYALASRLARQQAEALGDANDPYGGLGSNGAQHTPEAVEMTLLDAGRPYDFQGGRFHNLLGDALISGHGNVATPATAWALCVAISRS